MTTSEVFNELASAMAKAQGVMKPAMKESLNPAFHSKYADMASVWAACREALSANGLTVWQDVTNTEHGVAVVTRVVHTSGQWVEFGPLTVPLSKHDAHGVGSATSYAKRYALSAAVGVVASDEDDDATQGQGRQSKAQPNRSPQQPPPPRPTPNSSPARSAIREPQARATGPVAVQPGLANELPAQPEFITDIQRRKLWTLATNIGWREPELKDFLKRRFNIDSSKQIPSARYDEIVQAVQAGDVPQTEPAGTAS